MQRAPVYFHYSGVRVNLINKTALKEFIRKIFNREGKVLSRLDYVFCTDEHLHSMNLQWLDHDSYTDIISFDLSEDADQMAGEIYISLDRVRENAAKYKVPFTEELLRVIFHGALHLCGYKDKSKAQQSEMRSAEGRYLKLYGRST